MEQNILVTNQPPNPLVIPGLELAGYFPSSISKINHLLSRPAISVLVILNGYAEEASVVGGCRSQCCYNQVRG